MTIAGFSMLAIGAATIGAAAMLKGWNSDSKESALYAVGGGLAAGGVTLVVIGFHRRTAK